TRFGRSLRPWFHIKIDLARGTEPLEIFISKRILGNRLSATQFTMMCRGRQHGTVRRHLVVDGAFLPNGGVTRESWQSSSFRRPALRGGKGDAQGRIV